MKIYSVILLVLSISFITLMLVKQKARDKQLFRSGFRAKAVSVEKGHKGTYHVELIENRKLRYISVSYANGLRIYTGDSVYKESNSNSYYIKKDDMLSFLKLELNNVTIYKKWE